MFAFLYAAWLFVFRVFGLSACWLCLLHLLVGWLVGVMLVGVMFVGLVLVAAGLMRVCGFFASLIQV
eukprot:m.357094 g.357094  ORF g.357094 m.357094 type:complete len:67 (-) comp19935_c2_seq10:76-276(-)